MGVIGVNPYQDLFEREKEREKCQIEQDLYDDELSFEEAAFLMGYNDFA